MPSPPDNSTPSLRPSPRSKPPGKTTHPSPDKETIRAFALSLGFDVVRFGAAKLADDVAAGLDGYLAAGHHGDMAWMEDTHDRRRDPRTLWPDARSVIMVGLNYGPDENPLDRLAARDRGAISVYARHRDYHDVLKKRLKRLAAWLHQTAAADVKLFVDTAPVMEKPLAQNAGIGWQGKHTNLVSRRFGSWLFLGEVFTSLEIAPDPAETDHCGSCRKCLDVCPTDAFIDAHRIDARRCISYLTIEHKGHIPRDLRALMGNRIYGCDDCLAVCPWNKYAETARLAEFHSRQDLRSPKLSDLAQLDDSAFRALFSGSPIKRIGRDRFVRNVLIAIGNSGAVELAVSAERLLVDPSPLIRLAAIWALKRLLEPTPMAELRAKHQSAEPDSEVRSEWSAS